MNGFPQYQTTQNGNSSAVLMQLQSDVTWLKTNSGIKSIQRGVSAGSGTATITAVNLAKSVVQSMSKGSAGYVAARGTVALTATNQSYILGSGSAAYRDSASLSMSGSVTGGTTDLTAKQYSAVLTNSTTVSFDGPVEWQVIEYN